MTSVINVIFLSPTGIDEEAILAMTMNHNVFPQKMITTRMIGVNGYGCITGIIYSGLAAHKARDTHLWHFLCCGFREFNNSR